MDRLLKVGLCVTAGWLIAMTLSVVSYFAYWPPRWFLDDQDYLGVGLLGAAYVASLPLLTLTLMSIRKAPAPALSAAISAGWLLAVCLGRTVKPWRYFGEFPAWMLLRDFLQPLPVALATGLAFGLAARRLLGPNSSFKPTPLRGAA